MSREAQERAREQWWTVRLPLPLHNAVLNANARGEPGLVACNRDGSVILSHNLPPGTLTHRMAWCPPLPPGWGPETPLQVREWEFRVDWENHRWELIGEL